MQSLPDFIKVTQGHLSSLPGSLWMASLPPSMSTAPRSLVVLANFQQVHSVLRCISPWICVPPGSSDVLEPGLFLQWVAGKPAVISEFLLICCYRKNSLKECKSSHYFFSPLCLALALLGKSLFLDLGMQDPASCLSLF